MQTSFENRLYQKQAERITVLTEEIKRLEIENKSLKTYEFQARFYIAMVNAIGDNIMLLDEWKRFIGILRLANPDIPGITKAESQFE